MKQVHYHVLLIIPTATLASNASMRFGSQEVHQCDDPVATITNNDSDARIPERDANDVCSSHLGYCVGDCVAVQISGGGEVSELIHVIVGGDLPDPGTCSAIPEQYNYPKRTWDFTHAGKCGAGDAGEYNHQNCLVHDVCAWARCTDDHLAVPGGVGLLDLPGGDDDQFCGEAFLDAAQGWKREHGCLADLFCPSSHPDCILFECRNQRLDETALCAVDADCKGYCQFNTNLLLPTCCDGSTGDPCGFNDDCQPGSTCYGIRPFAYCRLPEGERKRCVADEDCTGYCRNLRCWDGIRGDACESSDDCLHPYTCKMGWFTRTKTCK